MLMSGFSEDGLKLASVDEPYVLGFAGRMKCIHL